ncbi:MAG: translation elongation factor Ts [Candidatus Levybacteria bacterium RIFOXYA1_FULL_41_10]|nr:MAG: Elongation factor Ts [Candidatus Levybacteria bacterium GW2011_GWA1_39_34]KKR51295.1 MAG: Elongation factor Ts [Candidatus Levybacteria bacterium GW2011_GWC1_40_19]KKR94619.1 MAG: Elongation factor Ts [Candidatus Levybacteria bacterium GW2011_GWA2_41_15]KKS00721.1 MAG: Elongation factor Ts [Candidatus Levybacteria bacterium GW2011_GWB1_41_21]OGH27009.1 MAG: translation elongation factor Ts [Candidatus Levybacteria bacterium RIFCSPHIGHO2_02_FULL_40_29]OGH31599.1 MAG: translation elongat
MSKVNLEKLKKLRNDTQASVADVRHALEESEGDYDKALSWLKKRGAQIAEKKAQREVGQGLIESYIHQNGKVGALVVILCETDFVARTDEFKNLAHEVAMQVAAMSPKDVSTLLSQEYIRDGSITIEGLIKQTIGKLGENIVVREFKRFEL